MKSPQPDFQVTSSLQVLLNFNMVSFYHALLCHCSVIQVTYCTWKEFKTNEDTIKATIPTHSTPSYSFLMANETEIDSSFPLLVLILFCLLSLSNWRLWSISWMPLNVLLLLNAFGVCVTGFIIHLFIIRWFLFHNCTHW